MDEEACKKAFIKAGFWPNEVMWSAWQNAWKQATELERDRCKKICDEKALRELDFLRTSSAMTASELAREISG